VVKFKAGKELKKALRDTDLARFQVADGASPTEPPAA